MSNIANGTYHDPRQQVAWDFYIETVLAGCPNALQSALKAGYAPSQADKITVTLWWKERLAGLVRKDMLTKAEKVLDRTLSYNPDNDEGEPKADLLRIQTDVAKHITKTLGKEHYSEKVELDHTSGGEPIKSIVYVVPKQNATDDTT